MRPIWAALTMTLQHLMSLMRAQPQVTRVHIFTAFADTMLFFQRPVSQTTDNLQSSIAASTSRVNAWLSTHRLWKHCSNKPFLLLHTIAEVRSPLMIAALTCQCQQLQ